MRLWTLHPRYLDAQGLVAAWREALLAQKVLQGATRRYRNHPQLDRFKSQPDPVAAIAEFLRGLHAEATARGYQFKAEKIAATPPSPRIHSTRGQLAFEWEHLLRKLARRAPAWQREWLSVKKPRPHSLFRLVAGGVEPWEV